MFFFTILVMGISVALPYIAPIANLLGFVPLPAIYWAWIVGFLALYCTITHFVKTWFFKKFGVD
jgi:Mg2+-importing ATPase